MAGIVISVVVVAGVGFGYNYLNKNAETSPTKNIDIAMCKKPENLNDATLITPDTAEGFYKNLSWVSEPGCLFIIDPTNLAMTNNEYIIFGNPNSQTGDYEKDIIINPKIGKEGATYIISKILNNNKWHLFIKNGSNGSEGPYEKFSLHFIRN
jgi:hypothetical protein